KGRRRRAAVSRAHHTCRGCAQCAGGGRPHGRRGRYGTHTMTQPSTTLNGLAPLFASGVLAVVRLSEAAAGGLRAIAHALAEGGVGAVEVTLTTPGAIDAIGDLAEDESLAGCVIGAGTVLDPSAARYVIDAGARFVVSPVL